MKTAVFVGFLAVFCSAAWADPRATIVVHPTASVTGDNFNLGDIATVTSADTPFRLALLEAPMGRCPLTGLTRPFNAGDVCLKLRQAGIDPDTVSISGAQDLVIYGAVSSTASGQSSNSVLPSPTNTSNYAPANPAPILIHAGDAVTLEYDGDGMSISASVVATSSGAAGDTINLRRDGAIHTLQGIVEDSRTVKMVE